MAARIPGRLYLVVWLLAGAAAAAGAVTLDVTASYTFILTAANLNPGSAPGADFAVHTSPLYTTMDVTIKHSNNNWRLDARRNDLDWPPNVTIRIRRSAGGAWLTLDGTYRQLFTGSGNLTKEDLQVEVTVSANDVNARIYTNRIEFRVTDGLP